MCFLSIIRKRKKWRKAVEEFLVRCGYDDDKAFSGLLSEE